IDAQPVHLAAASDLLLADDRDVVLGLAGDDAGAAAGTRRQVDGHAPLVARVLPLVAVERRRQTADLRRRVVGGEMRVLLVLLVRGGADETAALHAVVR